MNHGWIFRVITAAHFQICFSRKDLDEMLSGRYFNGDVKQYCETIRLTIMSFGICACVVTVSWKMMGQLQLFFDASGLLLSNFHPFAPKSVCAIPCSLDHETRLVFKVRVTEMPDWRTGECARTRPKAGFKKRIV